MDGCALLLARQFYELYAQGFHYRWFPQIIGIGRQSAGLKCRPKVGTTALASLYQARGI